MVVAMLISTSKLHRTLTSGLLVVGLLASSLTPAHAIFGLSKCEKVKKEILREEKISIFLYGLTKKSRDSALKDNSVTWGEYSKVLSKEILGQQSDIKVFDLMINKSSCFSAEINAYVRTYKKDTQENIKLSQSVIDAIFKQTSLTDVADVLVRNALRSKKWSFVSVYDKDFLKLMNS
jgi:hypothetical protein